MKKAVKLILDVFILLLIVVLAVVIILPQQKKMKEQLKFRNSRSNMYSVREAIEYYIFLESSVEWDPVRNSWDFHFNYPRSLEDIKANINENIKNPYTNSEANINVFLAESTLVENNIILNVIWDTTNSGQWIFESSQEIHDLWTQSGLEGIPSMLDDSILLTFIPFTGKILYKAWESEEQTPNILFTFENNTLKYSENEPPENEDELAGWLFNKTISDIVINNLPTLPDSIENIGTITYKFIWANPPEVTQNRRTRKPEERDSLEVEKPYILYSFYKYPENSFKPSYLVKEDDSDTCWLAQQSGTPGDISLYIAPPKYCMITFGEEGTPVLWEDPGKHKHLLTLWRPE